MRRACLLLWSLAPGLLATEARAAERPYWLGGGLGYMSIERSPYQGVAPGLHLGARAPINDQFLALAELSSAPYALKKPAPSPCPAAPDPCAETRYPFSVQGTTAAVGAAYVLDTTRLAPYGGVLLGLSRLAAGQGFLRAAAGQKAVELRLDLVIALGVDYQLDDRWSVGAAIRLHHIAGGATMDHYIAQVQRRF